MGVMAMLVMWQDSFEHFFVSPTPEGYIHISFHLEKKRSPFEVWTDDGRRQTTEPAYPINSPKSSVHLT